MTATEEKKLIRQPKKLAAGVRRFLWHFAQMVIVMEAGMIVYHLLLQPLLAQTGFAGLKEANPFIGYWAMVISMTLPMIVLMRWYHKSSWGYTLGMTGAMLAPLAALTVLGLCSLFPIHTLYGVGDPVMFLAMAAYMVLRPMQHAHSENAAACHSA